MVKVPDPFDNPHQTYGPDMQGLEDQVDQQSADLVPLMRAIDQTLNAGGNGPTHFVLILAPGKNNPEGACNTYAKVPSREFLRKMITNAYNRQQKLKESE